MLDRTDIFMTKKTWRIVLHTRRSLMTSCFLSSAITEQGFRTATQQKTSPDLKSGLSFSPSSFTSQTSFVSTSSPVYAASHYIPYNTPASPFSSPNQTYGGLSSVHWSSPGVPAVSPGGYYFRQSPGTSPVTQSFVGSAGSSPFVKSPSYPGQHPASYGSLSSSQSGSFNRVRRIQPFIYTVEPHHYVHWIKVISVQGDRINGIKFLCSVIIGNNIWEWL